MRKIIACLAVVAMASIANATNVTNLFPNGDFESGGAGAWVEGGCDFFSYPATDGNPGGYGIIDDTTPCWGIWVGGDATPLSLESLGLTAGQTYTFVQDMKIISGASIGGLKVESWANGASIGNSGDMRPVSGTTNWATYTFTYRISSTATGLKIVPLWGAGSAVGFDNLGVVVRVPEPVSVSVTSPAESQVVYSNFSISATAAVYPGTVTNVAFYLDGTLKGNDPSSPFAYNAIGVSSGGHTLLAVATDSGGNNVTSSVVNITVTNLTIPAGGITFDAASSGSTGNAAASSCTWSHTVGSGANRMLVVGISAESTTVPTIASVTYGGVALTHVTGGRAISGSGNYDSADQWYLMSPAVGTADIVVTFSATLAGWPNTGGAACGAVSLFGVTQDAPEAVAINNTGTAQTNTIATSITTLTADAWLVDVVNNGNGGSSFSGWPGTNRWDLRASSSYTICSGGGATVAVPTAGPVTETWTYGASSHMAQSIAAFSPAIPVLLSEFATITSPTNGAVVSTTSFTISADASVSPGAITNVNFYVDGSLVGNDTSSPFSYAVVGASVGAHALKVAAKDSNGNSVTSAVVNVTAQNFAPSVALSSPANGSAVLVGASVPLAATATDDGTVTSVDFYVDGSLVGSDASNPYNATWASATLGAHALTAVAHDNGGLSTTSAVVTITGLASFAAYESFNYAALPNGTPSTAQGFTGNWTCVGGSIVSGLTYTGLPTADNALSSSGGRQFVSFAAPLSSGTEWISFLCNQTGDPGAVKNGVYFLNGGTGLFCGFGLAPASAVEGRMGLGSMNTTGAGYQDATILSTSPNLQTYGTTYLVVLRIDFNTSGNNDTVTVYINPPVHANAPGVAADQTVSSFDVGTITGVGLNVGNTTFTVDEIRRGSSYAEVVGGTLNPTVPTTVTLSVGANKRISWIANSTNYYQPQESSDNSNWSDLGSLLFGSAVTSVFDATPEPFYQVLEIAPTIQEQIVDGGFEMDGGDGTAFYWTSGGSQHPTRITSDFHSGTACMSLFVTNTGIAANTFDLQQNLNFAGSPGVTGGNTYTFSFWAKSLGRNPAGGYIQQYRVAWLNGFGAVVGSVGFAGFTSGSGTWAQINTGPVVAPATAVNALIEIYGATGGISNDFGGVLIDDMSLSGFSPGSVINTLTPTIQNGEGFTATVMANGVTATDASGTVQFTTNAVGQSVGTVVNGSAFSAPAILPASYTVTATYSGDATYIGSTTTLVVGSGVNPSPTNITSSVSGNQLTLSWPADHTGWTLQVQTNSASVGLSTTWYDVAGSTATNKVIYTINLANPTVFYRLKY